MSTVANWALSVNPGESLSYSVHEFADLKITNAALGYNLQDETGRTTLTLTVEEPKFPKLDDEDDENDDEDDDEDELPITSSEIVLTSLTPGKIEQSIHDLIFSHPAKIIFKVHGKNTIHLAGNLLSVDDFDSDDDEEYDSDLDDAHHLHDVSSDVEIDPEDIELDSDAETDGDRFEEVVEEKVTTVKAGTKRPRESDGAQSTSGLSKAERKQLKKLKGTGGEAIPTSVAKDEPTKPAAKADAPEPKAKKDKKEKNKDKADKSANTDTAETKGGAKQTLTGGLVIQDGKLGNGKEAKKGSTVSVRYIGKLQDGSQFDANTKGKPFTFKVGNGDVIKGWDQGVVGMKVGGERRLVIPPELGYGKRKQSGIPANSTLTFEIKLLEVK